MTTDEKFTPGPWTKSPYDPTVTAGDERDPDMVIYNEGGHNGWDAHLIAAAPDLYAALEAALEASDLSGTTASRAVHDQGVRALRKARGEAA